MELLFLLIICNGNGCFEAKRTSNGWFMRFFDTILIGCHMTLFATTNWLKIG